jgi:hypothetical protein
VKEFQAAYGPDGDWASFFRTDPAYVRTHLLVDRQNPVRFLTIDFWSSYDAFVSFCERFSSRFEALDKSFERFTTAEEQIGAFDALGEEG